MTNFSQKFKMATIDKFKIQKLMAERKIKNFAELARMLGISSTQLSNVLSEKYSPIKSNVEELAHFLGVESLDILKK